ncbi:hypothetical protein RND81_07G192500 [Saponaria officinalis]|uniref:Major facilitator superfamily (MFS) profile domain-containing protein n=1 Tax=Saponaria officinalis TaxID=3572 RepID=A0AAW1JQ64_SAPOF
MARELLHSIDSIRDIIMFRDIKLLVHMLLPLFVHGIALEICNPFLMEIISSALCPAQSTCPDALYLDNLQQIVAGFLMVPVLILLCELSDEYGRKPFLLLTTSASILPVGIAALLALNTSRGFIYAYLGLRCVSYILSLRAVFCIAIAYAADVVEDEKRVAAFSWITGVMSASHVLGNVLAKSIPAKYSFVLSIPLMVVCLVLIHLFMTETVIRAPITRQKSQWFILIKLIKERCSSIGYAATTIMTRPSLRRIYLVSFLYEFGMSGISSVLLFYLKEAFDLKESKSSDTLIIVQIGSVFSQMLIVPVINGLAGEKAILCMGLLTSATYAAFYSVAWETWLPYISVSLGLAYGFVKPSLCAIVSRSSSSNNQGRAQGSLAAIEAIAGFISPFVMTPLTMWFLSHNAPFDYKGFGILCSAASMMAAMFCAMHWKPEATWNHDLKDMLLT